MSSPSTNQPSGKRAGPGKGNFPHKRKPLSERFWAKVSKSDDPDACWLWTGNIQMCGYGQICLGRKEGMDSAHRVSWELANGRPVPPGMCICHKCDVRACVRPDHLFLGTYAENLADMRNKGRGARITTNGKKKLTDEDVADIRRLRAEGVSQNTLARRFGVHQALISRIDKGYRRKAVA